MNAMTKIEGPTTEVELKEIQPPSIPPTAPPVAPAQVQAAAVPATPAPKKRRRGGRFLLMLAVPVALAGVGGYVWVTGGRFEETENASLRQARVTISADTAGRITEVDVSDNLTVHQGDVLFVVDPEPYRIALEQADAALSAARVQVEQLRATYSQAIAEEQVAAGEVDYAKSQFKRSTELSQKGISAKSALDEAQRDLDKADAEHRAAVQGIAGARAGLGGDPDIATDKHPAVLAALAARDKAAYTLAQTTVRAPADGVVSQAASFKAGQFVAVGTPLFSLVESGDSWVEANFKETQLTHMKPGQEADVVLDTFPDKTFRATVQAIGAGTGAEFSLLPAQNATGNWVKVTQRIPVRLKLEGEGFDLALRSGMSASVSVDTGVTRGLPKFLTTANAAD